MDKLTSLILASSSPRRIELLTALGLRFSVMPSAFDEACARRQSPDDLAMARAAGKAEEVADRRPESLVIGADTLVLLGNEILGKPRDPDEAVSMLSRLSDRTHTVKTGVCLLCRRTGWREAFVESTDVTFGPLSPRRIRRYVDTGEPMDKAGAYGIQGYGATLVKEIAGCYFNVVGLPIYRLARSLESAGIFVP